MKSKPRTRRGVRQKVQKTTRKVSGWGPPFSKKV